MTVHSWRTAAAALAVSGACTPLLPVPAMAAVPETLAVTPLQLPFGIVADAVAYPVQVAAGTNCRSALLDMVVDSPPQPGSASC